MHAHFIHWSLKNNVYIKIFDFGLLTHNILYMFIISDYVDLFFTTICRGLTPSLLIIIIVINPTTISPLPIGHSMGKALLLYASTQSV